MSGLNTSKSAQNLFTFIREFAKLKQRPSDSLDQYFCCIWLHDLPRSPQCACRSLEENRSASEGSGSWLTIRRPSREDPPNVPAEIWPWVDQEQWEDSSLAVPELLSCILSSDPGVSQNSDVVQYLYLEEYPEIKAAWEDYVQNQWLPWAQKDRADALVQEVYNEFFRLQRTQVMMGEQFEFLLAVGCLHWAATSGSNIKRHLITLPVSIEFDANLAEISVVTAAGMDRAQLEMDMLGTEDRPAQEFVGQLEERCQHLGDSLFAQETRDLLKELVHGLHSEGVFYDIMAGVSENPPNKPTVSFSPAIIVRRRTQKSLVSACDRILSQISDDPDIMPTALRKIVGELGVDDLCSEADLETDTGEKNNEAFFPFPFNDEQKRTLERLQQESGVLVQGPPGTGKSQTIANLICHLLASGQKILVTSQKAPALRVLKGFLEKNVPEAADLCIAALGEGLQERQELKRSVEAIANRNSRRDPVKQQQEITSLRDRLENVRREKEDSFASLCALRAKEHSRHKLRFGGYEGVLAEIAEQIRKEEESFKWFTDSFPHEVSLIIGQAPDLPVSPADAERLLTLLRELDEQSVIRCSYPLVSLEQLPEIHEFQKMVEEESLAWRELQDRENSLKPSDCKLSEVGELGDQQDLLQEMDDFIAKLQELYNESETWTEGAVRDLSKGKNEGWRELHDLSVSLLDDIRSLPVDVCDLEIQGIPGRKMRSVKRDARELKQHIVRGGKLGFWKLRPQAVKNGLYIIREITVEGRQCRDPEMIQRLIDWLNLQESLHKLEEQWLPIVGSYNYLPLNQRIRAYEQCTVHLARILELAGVKGASLKRRMQKVLPEIQFHWHDLNSVQSLRDIISVLAARKRLKMASESLEKLESNLLAQFEQSDTAPVNQRILRAVRERSVEAFRRARSELGSLWECRKKVQEKDRLIREIQESLPRLVQDMLSSFDDPVWKDRLQLLPEAWNWVCADRWLAEITAPESENVLENRLRLLRKEERLILSSLASELAWEHCLSGLTEEDMQSLVAWRKAVERLGKGTGKHAEKKRGIAKERLAECRSVVPAWVMPFYKVLDTVSIEPGVFDVVIVDEASQSGLDGIILSYLAKKMVIVGDDQQIRPDNVGIDHDEVFRLQDEYLQEIPKSDIFGPDESLFSIAEVKFGNAVRLREHFRSMPEIISFSNQLCYQDQPLHSLRQFGNDRLSPTLHAEYVESGFQKEDGTNPEEISRIVDAIELCCNDPVYAGKTIGVISLLSSSQQDREIGRQLQKRLPPRTIEAHNIFWGDAYDFQGDERDVIFLSMVTAQKDGKRLGVLSGEQPKRRFNVAASRARDQLFLFHSIRENELSEACLRRRLISHMNAQGERCTGFSREITDLAGLQAQVRQTDRKSCKPPNPFDTWMEVDVCLKIAEHGFKVLPKYEVNGYLIDLVVAGGNQRIAVVCDGDRQLGPEKLKEEMHLQSQLERCGWNFVRIKAGIFYRDAEKGLEQLWSLLLKTEKFRTKEEQVSDLGVVSSSLLETQNSIYNLRQWNTDIHAPSRASAQ